MTHTKIINLSIMNQRLTELMKKRKFNIQSLSNASGVGVGTVHKMLSDPSCNPTYSSLKAISDVLETNVSFLLGQNSATDANSNKVPVFKMGDLNVRNNAIAFDYSVSVETVRTDSKVGKNAFAIRMVGRSMEPLFPEGTILIFDQNITPFDQAFALVKLSDYADLVFKKLIIDPPNIFISPINPAIKDASIQSLTEKDNIIAILAQAQYDFMRGI